MMRSVAVPFGCFLPFVVFSAMPLSTRLFKRAEINAFDTTVVTAGPGDEPDSEGAMWRKGKTFTDAAAKVFVRIDDIDVLRGTAQVTIGPTP